MEMKLKDEKEYRRELEIERYKARENLEKLMTKNSKTHRAATKRLRNATIKVKKEYKQKYEQKIIHLKKKYREDEEEKLRQVPEEMKDLESLSIFDKEKFEAVEIVKYEVEIIGELNVSEEEKMALALPPKFSIMEKLPDNDLEMEKETLNAKIRIQINKELEELLEGEKLGESETKEEMEIRKRLEEMEARSRQVFDAETKEFDDRNRRVTDLRECSRITLPRPLPAEHEAIIEMRRSAQTRIYREYRKKHCDKNGDQKTNLKPGEKAGIKSLDKRVGEQKVVVMKTDKSSKFCITTLEEYRKMGETHVAGDKKINREEMKQIERVLNGHTVAWAKMQQSGENHGHKPRIIASKSTKSDNA